MPSAASPRNRPDPSLSAHARRSKTRPAPPGTADIIDLVAAVKAMVENAHTLIETVGDMSLDGLEEVCGLTAAQAAAFRDLVTLAHDATHVVNRAIIGLSEL